MQVSVPSPKRGQYIDRLAPESGHMRITFEIDEKELRRIQKITGQKNHAAAISAALGEFLQMRKRQAFVEKVLTGKTDYALTNAELEAREMYQPL